MSGSSNVLKSSSDEDDHKFLAVYGKLHPETNDEPVSTLQYPKNEAVSADSEESEVYNSDSSLGSDSDDNDEENEYLDSSSTKKVDDSNKTVETNMFQTSKYIFNVNEIKARIIIKTELNTEEPVKKKQKLNRNSNKQSKNSLKTMKIHKFRDDIIGISENSGIATMTSPSDIFSFFLDETLVEYLLEEINKYAEQVITQRSDPLSKTSSKNFREWKPATKGDIYTFIGLFLIMSVVRKPAFKYYWSSDPLISTEFFPLVMTHNRFILIWTFFDFMDDSGQDGYDKMKKFRLIYEHFNSRFQDAYKPGEYIGIKENLMLWKDRTVSNNFVKSKRTRFGIKTFELFSCQNGYVYKNILCTGRASDFLDTDENERITDSAVMRLSEELQRTGRTLYLDISHCSLALFNELHSNQMNVIGSVLYNRTALPEYINVYNMKRRESVSYEWNKVHCTVWNDTTPIVILSTIQPNTNSNEKPLKKTKKPAIVTDYNKHMKSGTVIEDVTDTFPALKKTYKCHKKLFLHLIDVCAHNAMCLYNEINEKKMDYTEFRLSLVRSIFENFTSVRPTKIETRTSDSKLLLRLTGRHFPSYIPPTPKKLAPTRRCAVCSTKCKRRETRYRCKDCNVGLCVQPCFQIYHEIKNY